MSDAPIKACDFCNKQGKMPTYQNGMTICWDCQKALPATMQDALHEITTLRAQLAQAEGRCAAMSHDGRLEIASMTMRVASLSETLEAIREGGFSLPECQRMADRALGGAAKSAAILRLQAEAVEAVVYPPDGIFWGTTKHWEYSREYAQRLRDQADQLERS